MTRGIRAATKGNAMNICRLAAASALIALVLAGCAKKEMTDEQKNQYRQYQQAPPPGYPTAGQPKGGRGGANGPAGGASSPAGGANSPAGGNAPK
jgi:hypothetical protein